VPLSDFTGEPAPNDNCALRNRIVFSAVKPVPITVTRVPTGPDVGANELIVGGPEATCATAPEIATFAKANAKMSAKTSDETSDEIAQTLLTAKDFISPRSI
jgi:hypothetical protein